MNDKECHDTLYKIINNCTIYPLANPEIIKKEYKKYKILSSINTEENITEEKIVKEVSKAVDITQKMKSKNKWIKCDKTVTLQN